MIRAIAFDCYGTLIDVTDEAFVAACAEILTPHGLAHDAKIFFDRWLEASRELATRAGRDRDNPVGGPEPPFIPFRERWPEYFELAFATFELKGDSTRAYQVFHDTLAQGIAYPDTVPALTALERQYKLAVVSNADEDHLREALARNQIGVNRVLSSETARSYKPRRPIFRQGAELLGEHPHDVLYVGDSPNADVVGARYAGMQIAWLNRAGIERPAGIPKPDYEVRDLTELARVLLEGDGGMADGDG